MRPLKNFKEFISSGIVKKQSKDINRAKSLIKESEKSYIFLIEIIEKIGISDDNANIIIKQSYDIIMELIRAMMISDGYNSSGMGAHEAEVSFLRKVNFPESDIQFVNQLRYFRNGIVYYGKNFNKEYCKKVIKFLENIKGRLKI